MREIIAHKEEEKIQTLKEHLLNTAKEAAKKGEKIGLKKSCYLLGILHDIGKADPKFQDMIYGKGSKVNHSSAGSKILFYYQMQMYNNIEKNDLKLFIGFIETMGLVIQSHHGLFDVGYDGNKSRYYDRIKYNEKKEEAYNFEEVEKYLSQLEDEIIKEFELDKEKFKFSNFIYEAFLEYKNKCNILFEGENLQKESKSISYYRGLFFRLYLSILKTADILDTINAYEDKLVEIDLEKIKKVKNSYINFVEKKYSEFKEPVTLIDKARSELAIIIKERGQNDEDGIYKLNLPTGAGKTLLSLRYGMTQLKEKDKDRFFYITPFLSVLEQNAFEIKKILNQDENILEHHSNIVEVKDNIDENEEEKEKNIHKEYLLDTWNSPVVLTTMVQFYNTLFKEKSVNIRRFSSLINAVIIIDEIQSLPSKVIYLTNLTLNFLKIVMRANIILSTATQPTFDNENNEYKMLYGNLKNENQEICNLTLEQREKFERVEVRLVNQGKEIGLDEVRKLVEKHNNESILVIFNTKKTVKRFYEMLKETFGDKEIYYLSTNLCAEHRKDKIEEIKRKLKNKEKIICVSTQLIEAGVDIDFEVVIRSFAGIESIVQAIGRCNREGKMSGKGKAYLVNLSNKIEKIDALKEINEKKEVTKEILDIENKEVIEITSLNDKFYKKYFTELKSNDKSYPLGKDQGTILELLSTNKDVNLPYNLMKQSFKTAAEKFNLIEENTTSVIVYYGEGKEKIEELIQLCNEYEENFEFENLVEIKKILKELQPYSVNIYNLKNIDSALYKYLNDTIMILCENNYSDEFGVMEEIEDILMI